MGHSRPREVLLASQGTPGPELDATKRRDGPPRDRQPEVVVGAIGETPRPAGDPPDGDPSRTVSLVVGSGAAHGTTMTHFSTAVLFRSLVLAMTSTLASWPGSMRPVIAPGTSNSVTSGGKSIESLMSPCSKKN